MKTITKLLVFTCLVLLLVGIVSATEITSNTTSTTEHACEIADNTQTASHQASLNEQDINKIEKDEKTNIREDIETKKKINKNTNNRNVKEEPETVRSWENLTQAVSNAESATEDTTIILNQSTYTNTGTITWSNTNIVLTIDGNGQTIDGNQNQVFYINPGASLILKNITITNANARDGGAIYNNNGTLAITDSRLNNNNARGTGADDGGGAIYNNQGTLTITNTNLNNNTAADGGAINNNNGTINITNTNLTNNNANTGGAINNQEGTININNTNINNNNATLDGGAIYNWNGTINITNNTNLNNNTAADGGAIYTYKGTINITDSTLNNNNATQGGAIRNYEGTINITDSTLNNNNATQGGAIRNYKGTINIANTNINNNNATYLGGAIYNNNGTINITNTNINNNNATYLGGAIYNNEGTLTVTNNSTLNNNTATNGGAIDNYGGTLTVTNSSMFEYNQAVYGGAICNNNTDHVAYYNVSVSNFTNNNASYGAAIYTIGNAIGNITYNNFTENTADNNETLDLDGERTVENNAYHSTDISLKTINLTVKDNQEIFQYPDDVELNFTIELTTKDNYDIDILEKIDKTIYINNTENATTNSTNYTLSNLDIGKYTAYYTTCNQESDIANFKVIGNLKITTDKESYDYYDGINNKITLQITDDTGEKGTITISVKDGEEYTKLSSYPNMEDGFTISTETIAEALENIYSELSPSYTINITYNSDLTNPSSTEFTLNIIKLRNTTIIYDILNRTEGNVQINITVIDTIYKSPIPDARIEITGNITKNTTSGILTNNTLTEGKYTITIKFNETEKYNPSETTINFNVEIDKDAKITEMEDTINNLTQKLNNAYAQIDTLNNTVKNLTEQLKNATDKIESLNENINELKEQLTDANNVIKDLNDTNNDLNDQLTQANDKIKLLEDAVNNLTDKLENANKEINELMDIIDEILNKQPINTTITINPIKSSVGTIATLTANIVDINGNKVSGGKAVFKINGITLKDETGNVIYARVSDGLASIQYKVQDVWMKDTSYIEAVYSGTNNYTSSRTKSTNALQITQGTANITLDKDTITAMSGETITLRAKITDTTGDRINTGKVVFKLNGKTLKDENGNTLYAKVTDGEATLDYTIPAIYSAKTYTLTAVYGGGNYERSETTGTLKLERKAVNIKENNITTTNHKTTIKATIIDETGKLLVTSTKLAFKINGKTILNGVNSTNGKINVSFTTTLRPGIYELEIISGENSIYKKGTLTTVLKI